MVTDSLIEKKFTELLKRGDAVLQSSGWDGREYLDTFPRDDEYQQFRVEVTNLLKRVCGDNSVHYYALKQLADDSKTRLNSFYFKDCVGVLRAAYQDYRDGFLVEIKYLIRADLLEDFLSQAEQLVAVGCHIPAASLTGAVIEDTLRKLCDKNGIPYLAKTNIDALNSHLAKAQTYDKLVQKQITAHADIRNNADHGHFQKVKEEDVKEMIRWAIRFTADHLK